MTDDDVTERKVLSQRGRQGILSKLSKVAQREMMDIVPRADFDKRGQDLLNSMLLND